VHIDLRRLDAVMTVPDVVRQVSVIVCDYAMPGMDGLAFFEQLADPLVRRVMLTALCDEHQAVQAFNRGLIHQFVRKADAAGPRGLEAVLRAQQRAWFAARSGPLAAALALGDDARVLQHPAVDDLREAALRERHADRFVASLAPAGYRLAGGSTQARAARLMLADGARFDRAARAVAEVDGPAELADALRTRAVMPYTRSGGPILDLLEHAAGTERDAQTVAPRIAEGAEPLYWALVDEPA
jgi:CheY-like chemotaxis protein